MRRPKPVHQLTSAQFDAMFPVGDEEACKAYLVARRWPNGVACPRCGNTDIVASSWRGDADLRRRSCRALRAHGAEGRGRTLVETRAPIGMTPSIGRTALCRGASLTPRP